jgi:GntR family phosphonate transport system transcriptional regulator
MLKDPSPAPAAPGDAAVPLRRWEQIAAELRTDILQGRFAPGTRLPNEIQLATRFAVHRHTLRQAMRQLVHEGHVKVMHGSGTYVRELVLDYALQRRTRLSENLAQAGEHAERELLMHEEAAAGPWAAGLQLGARDRVALLYTRATVRGRPVGISTAAFPLPRLAGIAQAFAASGSVTQALRTLGVADYLRAHSTVSCRLPTQAEADALARPATEPVLCVQFVNVDAEGRPAPAGTTLFAADAVQLTVAPDAT